jgi:glycosylphosphatidylinositol transamidase (GPIT) subunit GPI8
MMSEAQKRAIYNLSRRRGISVEQLEQMVTDAYGCDLENLTSGDASAFIRQLQQAA